MSYILFNLYGFNCHVLFFMFICYVLFVLAFIVLILLVPLIALLVLKMSVFMYGCNKSKKIEGVIGGSRKLKLKYC